MICPYPGQPLSRNPSPWVLGPPWPPGSPEPPGSVGRPGAPPAGRPSETRFGNWVHPLEPGGVRKSKKQPGGARQSQQELEASSVGRHFSPDWIIEVSQVRKVSDEGGPRKLFIHCVCMCKTNLRKPFKLMYISWVVLPNEPEAARMGQKGPVSEKTSHDLSKI